MRSILCTVLCMWLVLVVLVILMFCVSFSPSNHLTLAVGSHSSNRDSRALLESMRQRNTGAAQVYNDSISLDETPPHLSMSKSMTLRIRIGSSTERFSVGVVSACVCM